MKKKNFLVFLFSCFFVFFGLFVFSNSNTARAAEVGIKISPIKIDDLVQPGDVIQKTVTVTNDSPGAKTFYVYLNDFVADGENGQAKLVPPGSEDIGLSSWVNIPKEGFDFAPHAEREIKFTINVPKNVAPGGYYGAVLVGTEAPKIKVQSEDKGAGMAMSQKTACLLLLQVAGDIYESASVREFMTDRNFYSTPFDVKFNIRIENSGNTHIKPIGSVNIKNMFGKDAANVSVNGTSANILRKSIRRFDNHWSDKLGFGRYKAVLGLSYGTPPEKGGQGKQSLYAETTFWIIPWKIILPIMAGLILSAYLFVVLLRFYKNRAIKRAMEQMGARKIPYTKKYHQKTDDLILRLSIGFVVFLIFGLVIYFIFFA